MKKLNDDKLIVLDKDSFNLFPDFIEVSRGKLEDFVDDGTWPSIYDEFVETYKKWSKLSGFVWYKNLNISLWN